MPIVVTPQALIDIEMEHSLLVAQVRNVCDAFDAEQPDRERAIQAIRELQRLAISHFAHEESLMNEGEHADIPAHKRDHQYLLRSISEYISMFYDGAITITRGGGKGFLSWINYHEKKYDNFISQSMAELPPDRGEAMNGSGEMG